MTSLGRVLCIEDDDDVLTVLGYALRRHGASEVLLARDGEAGLLMAREHVPDLILCDLMLPAKDGLTVTRELKADPELQHIPVVFITAYATAAFRDFDPKQEGALGVISKPFRVQTLAEELKAMLDGRSG